MEFPKSSDYKICFITLGCAKNEVDTAHMRDRVLAAGFIIGDDPADADAIIINTCSFIQAATEESLEMILDVAGLPSVSEGRAKLIVAGCMPARYGEELSSELQEVEIFVPCSVEDDIVKILNHLFAINDTVQTLKKLTKQIATSDQPTLATAYVKISDGCDRFCSFCTIPLIRGRYRSFTLHSIVSEIDELLAKGVREIVLIAQDTGRWGIDLEEPSTLVELLDTLARRYPDTWLRVMYLQPEGITDKLLEIVNKHSNICSYFDIPLQHVDPQILKLMNRKGSLEDTFALLEKIRSKVRDVTLRTTLIAGFPGENEEAFELLCDFVSEAAFDYVGVFPYSREEGTKAALLSGQIDEEEKRERAQILRDIADSVGNARVAERIGSEYEVLVLGHEEDGQLYGRAQCQAPEVDGVIYLEKGEVGDFRQVKITDTLLYEMEGE